MESIKGRLYNRSFQLVLANQLLLIVQNKILIQVLLFFLSAAGFPQGLKRKVLFLGNSYTQFNNLPGLLASAAASVGDTLEFDFNYPGGHTLDQHFGNTQSINKIKEGGWDFVVLQDQSQRPALPQYSFSAAINLSALIRKHNPCSRPLFYMTWGRKNGDSQFCSSWPPVCTYDGMDSLLGKRYLEMAQINKTEVSPVGATWKFIRQNHPTIELYNADESHPSLAGSYAAACSFFASVFKKDPATVTYNGGLPAATAAIIRQAAKTVVFDSLANWYFPDAPPKAAFGYRATGGNNSIQMINQSLRADTRFWHFGDGDTSTQVSPTHTYAADGTYTITLTVSRCDLGTQYIDSLKKTVQFCSFTPSVSPDTIMLCTLNPDTLLTQAYESYQWFNEYGDSIPNATNRYFIPTIAGLHAVIATKNGCAEMSAPAFVDAMSSFNFYYVDQVSEDTICVGDTVLLVLKPVTSPMPADQDIQWFRNGVIIPISGNDTLRVTTSGLYHSVVIDSLYCPGSPLFTTSGIPITFNNCQVSVEEKRATGDISIIPNPGKEFSIQIPSTLVGNQFWVADVFGKAIIEGSFNKERNIVTLNEVKNGVYFLRFGNGKNFRLIRQ